jgi:chloride channel protein, CIC family
LVGKMVAASLTIGIGGSGGVFGPSLFIGAMAGAAFGATVHHLLPHATAPAGAYALVGMGAVFAGAARTPITAVVIMFELTGEYTIILPLMVAIALAAGTSRLISPDTIYTRKLLRRGIDIERPRPTVRLDQLTVAAATGTLPTPLTPEADLQRLAARFADDEHEALPVVDATGRLRGVVLAMEVEQAIRDAADVTAADLARTVPVLHADQRLEDALAELVRHGGAGLPVQKDGEQGIKGWLTHRDVLRAAAGVTGVPTGPAAR